MNNTLKDWLEKGKDFAQKHPKATLIIGGSVGLGILLATGSSLVINAATYGILVVAAFGIVFWKMLKSKNKLVQKVANFLRRNHLMTDIGVTLLTFLAGPSGVTGIIGAGVACLLTSILLGIMAPEEKESSEVATQPSIAGASA